METAFKILPKNFLNDWGAFESWESGVSDVPTGWIASTAATYAQDATNKKFGLYGLAITGGSFPFGGVYRTIPEGTDHSGKTISLGIWAKCSASSPYVSFHDGISQTTVHLSTVDAWEELKITKQIDSSNTQLRIDLTVPAGETAYFDGAVLCEGEDLFTQFDSNIDISSFDPALNIRNNEYEIANREGTFIPDYNMGSKRIRVRGNIVGTDTTSCRTHLDDFMKSLLSWQKTDTRDLYLYDDRVLEVFLKTFQWNYVKTLSFVKYNMQFIAPESVSRYIGKQRTSQVISGTVTEFNIPYLGNAESLPQISIIADQGGAITTCTLENLTTRDSFSYIGTVPTGVALNIDCFSPSVKNSSVDKIEDFTGIFWGLVRGTNYLKFSGSNCTIKVDYFDRWIA